VKPMVDEILSNYPSPARVILIAERVAESQIQLIHEVGDCFFSLAHSEGWGLGVFEAAVAGNSVIITGWGGQLDYLPAESSYLVKYDLKPVLEMRAWESYQSSQNWAYADINDACRQLRCVYRDQGAAKEKGRQLQTLVSQKFNFTQVTSDLLMAIADAHSK
jgi:hypothetical protein